MLPYLFAFPNDISDHQRNTGAQKLKQELDHLRKVDRPEVVAAIEEARSKGDLSENAE